MISNIIKNAAKTKKLIVVIRTNSSESVLTVNAPADTVHHYDYLDSLTVTAVAGASYHEHGTVKGRAVLSQGHIEVEQGAKVSQVSVENVPEGKTAKVTANEPTIITVDSSSASKTAVVSNSNEVYVDGVSGSAISGSKASEVIQPTEIDTELKLKNLMDNGGLAKLTANIDLTASNYSFTRKYVGESISSTENSVLATNKKVVLNMNGHNITGETLADDVDFIAVGDEGSLTVYDEAATKGRIIANAKMFYVRGSLEILDGEFVTTVLCSNTDYRSLIIADQGSSLMIRNGKFYTPKCVITGWGNVTIEKGDFVCASSSKGWSISSFAYVIRLGDGVNTINGGNFYGIHGAISLEGGKSTVANVVAEASEDTLEKFSAYVVANNILIHTLDNKAGAFLVDSSYVSSNKSKFKPGVHYGLYSAGEDNIVYATVNSGSFKSSRLYGALIGNKNDGGLGFYSHVTINGGTFIGASGQAAVSETGINTTYGAGYTEIFGGRFSSNVSSLMKDTVHYQCNQVGDYWEVSKK